MKTFNTPPVDSPHFAVYSDGHLHDHRNPLWASQPFRLNFKQTFPRIETLAQVKATLRAGPVAWPGCYPLALFTQDGAALCFACAVKEFRQICWDFLNKASTGWRIAGCDVNWEDSTLFCDHCGNQIPSAYGEDKEEA